MPTRVKHKINNVTCWMDCNDNENFWCSTTDNDPMIEWISGTQTPAYTAAAAAAARKATQPSAAAQTKAPSAAKAAKAQPAATQSSKCREGAKHCPNKGRWGQQNVNIGARGKLTCFLKLKPNPNGEDYISVKGNTIKNLGNKINGYPFKKAPSRKKTMEKTNIPPVDEVTFDGIVKGSNTNEKLYKDSLEKKMKTIKNNDVFIAAYGTSGSGKTYTLLGKEGVKGILNFALEDIKKQKPKSIKLLPLQIYQGSVYNAYYPGNVKVEILDNPESKFPFFTESGHKECVIPEFNYVDMLDKEVPERVWPDPENAPKTENSLFNYPPSRELIECLFNVSDETKKGYQARDISNKSVDDMINLINNKIIPNRPVRQTVSNPESSRSHLFLIFQLKFDSTMRYFTLLDMAGYENIGISKFQLIPEAEHIINGGIVPFRKMITKYKTGKGFDEIFGVKGQNPLIHCGEGSYVNGKAKNKEVDKKTNGIATIEGGDAISYNINLVSSAMFNILRGVSGMCSDNKSENVMYVMAYEKWDSEKKDMSVTDTVLFTFAQEWPDAKQPV